MEVGHIIKTHKGYFQLIENELGHRTYIPCEKPKKPKKEKKIKPQIKKTVTTKLVNKICNNSTLNVGDIIKRYYYKNGKKEGQEQIVALYNNKRVLIDIPKGVF